MIIGALVSLMQLQWIVMIAMQTCLPSTTSAIVSSAHWVLWPLNGRNVLNLVALVPGVVPQGVAMGNLTGKNIFSAGNFQIGGGAANQGATYLDGAPVNVNYGNLTALVPTQDAVAEFRVHWAMALARASRPDA